MTGRVNFEGTNLLSLPIDYFETTTAAQDALLLVGASAGSGGVLISSTSNRFENVLEGVRLDIAGANGASVKVTVASTSTDLVTRVQATVGDDQTQVP